MERDTETDGYTLSEPLECCTGVRTIWTSGVPTNGRIVALIAVSHDLWCCQVDAIT